MRCCRPLSLRGLGFILLFAVVGLPWSPRTEAQDTSLARPIAAPAGPELQGAALETRTEAVSKKLRCPVCQGMSVEDSPSASARAMKGEIEDLLAQGYSEAQVKEYFESRYGEFVLLDPKREGLNWLVWLAPGAIFFGGLLCIAVVLRRRNSQPANQDGEDLDSYLSDVRARFETNTAE